MTTDTSATTPAEQLASVGDEHDHAWRRVHPSTGTPRMLGEYQCALCAAVWSL